MKKILSYRLELKAFENKNIDNEKENGENVINVQIPAITSSSDFEIIAHLNKHLLKLLQVRIFIFQYMTKFSISFLKFNKMNHITALRYITGTSCSRR